MGSVNVNYRRFSVHIEKDKILCSIKEEGFKNGKNQHNSSYERI